MKKRIIKTLIIGVASLVVFASCSKKTSDTYPWTGEVVALNYESDIVTVRTGSGLTYEFTGCEDYAEGDLVSLLMDDMGTPETVLDDKVVEARYSGLTAKFN